MPRHHSRKHGLNVDGDRVNDERNDGSHKTDSPSDVHGLVQGPILSANNELAAQPQAIAMRFVSGALQTVKASGKKESLPLYRVMYLNWPKARKRIQHSEGWTYLVENGRYPDEVAFIELNLTYPMSTDIYTYFGLVGRSVKRPADATDDFYASKVTDDEALTGLDWLSRKWEKREGGPFVDSRLLEKAEGAGVPHDGAGIHLPWAQILMPSSAQRRRSHRIKDAAKLDDGEDGEAFNVIPPTGRHAAKRSKKIADQPQQTDICTRVPELMLTNLLALAPVKHRELFSAANDSKTYNSLVASLYHPNVHIYNVALQPGVYPSRLCEEVTNRFLRHYEETYVGRQQSPVKIDSQFRGDTTHILPIMPVKTPVKRARRSDN